MKLRLEITIECDDDVRAEDCQAVAASAAMSARAMLAPAAVFSTWQLAEVRANGAGFIPGDAS